MNITTPLQVPVRLPFHYPNGTSIFLGDTEHGYPPMLYPNLTQSPGSQAVEAFPGVSITAANMLVLGPLIINDTYAIVSLTQPMLNNSNRDDVLGYVTVIAAAKDFFKIETSPEGLGDTGLTLLLGPNTEWNRFNTSFIPANKTTNGDPASLAAAPVKFIIPVVNEEGEPERHNQPEPGAEVTFPLVKYPAALQAYSQQLKSVNNASGILDTVNENGAAVSVGVARPPTSLVDWVVIVEQTQTEALAPIALLRKILLICVFATVGLVLLIMLPFAHVSVLPIRRLRAATETFVSPLGYDEERCLAADETDSGQSSTPPEKRTGLAYRVKKLLRQYEKKSPGSVDEKSERHVKIPGKIEIRRHLIVDELTDLTKTFNEMSDELMQQYTQLEDKVAERTRELELSKKAAEAANQSKTVFLANISHELKTPLNGILGMCSVCMEDTDLGRVKRSLKTVYESGK
jgi:osomolarity two-component system sensor histidine kinase SLN1